MKDDYCNICKKVIDKKGEYSVLTQFDKDGEFYSEAFYHIKCFMEWASDRKTLDKGVKEMLDKTNKILERVA